MHVINTAMSHPCIRRSVDPCIRRSIHRSSTITRTHHTPDGEMGRRHEGVGSREQKHAAAQDGRLHSSVDVCVCIDVHVYISEMAESESFELGLDRSIQPPPKRFDSINDSVSPNQVWAFRASIWPCPGPKARADSRPSCWNNRGGAGSRSTGLRHRVGCSALAVVRALGCCMPAPAGRSPSTSKRKVARGNVAFFSFALLAPSRQRGGRCWVYARVGLGRRGGSERLLFPRRLAKRSLEAFAAFPRASTPPSII